jgi:hypothetical protein
MSNDALRDRLLELEPYPEDLKEMIREKISHTKERPLKTWERPFLAFCCVALGVGLLVGAGAIIQYFDRIVSNAPTYVLVALPVAFLLICWTIVVLSMSLKKGVWRPFYDSSIVYPAFGFAIYMIVAMMLTGGGVRTDELAGLMVIGVCVIVTLIKASELRLRERVLRNELAVAKLSELVAERLRTPN